VRWTPLHVAIHEKHRDIAILLLERGANTEARSSRDRTALYMASSRGCAVIVQQLISHGADLNAECSDCDMCHNDVKWTPLHVAMYRGTRPIAKTLLDHGANPNAPGILGATALHLVPYWGWVAGVELLLEYGASVDTRDRNGWTPLHRAAHRLSLEVVVVLLNHGADPRVQTNNGETPIQLADAPRWFAPKENKGPIIRLLSLCTRERMWGLGSLD